MKLTLFLKLLSVFTLQIIWRIVGWIFIPFMLPFAYKVPSKDVPYKAHLEVQKYRLPKYLQWVDLLDDYGIGGVMYEPTVYGWYKKWGVWVAAWLQLSWRNVGHGLYAGLTKPAINFPVHLTPEQIKAQGLESSYINLLIFKIGYAYSVYRIWKDTDTDDIWTHTFIAIPKIGIKWGWSK